MNIQQLKKSVPDFWNSFRKNGDEEKGVSCSGGLAALYRKELADHLNSKRFFIIFMLLLVVTTASLGGALSNIREAVEESSDFIFLKLFTTSGSAIYSFATFMAFLGPLAGITLGFDAVSNERSQGTLNRLAAQPIYRDSIINAKFLAGSTVIFLTVFMLGFYISGMGLMLIGIPPSGEEVLRIFAFLLFTWVYISFWLALSIIFSVVCKHAATAALASMSIWLFLSLFMSLVASAVANSLFPTSGIAGFANISSNYSATLALNRISPYYLFSEAATTILNPNVRSIGMVTMSQLSGAIAGPLPFSQSLLLVWPHLVLMIALVIAGFAIAYIAFMKQEIRA
ncbi:ABC transporter permease subunit [Angelakisella massiliensis]|uniref:ABC transporter permease n=1 Tax=Angelakisella massiliensis TaxID=1871018 RepID=UPI0024B16885|nr:ABC transporter permease subunit [Angelakisella massiliensis]